MQPSIIMSEFRALREIECMKTTSRAGIVEGEAEDTNTRDDEVSQKETSHAPTTQHRHPGRKISRVSFCGVPWRKKGFLLQYSYRAVEVPVTSSFEGHDAITGQKLLAPRFVLYQANKTQYTKLEYSCRHGWFRKRGT